MSVFSAKRTMSENSTDLKRKGGLLVVYKGRDVVNKSSILYQRCFLILRNKRFRSVSEQRKTEELAGFWFWPREKWNESQKIKEGGGRGEGTTAHTTTTASRNIRSKKTRTAVFCYKALSSPQAPAGYHNKNSNNRKNIKRRGTALPTIQRGHCRGESGLQATPHCWSSVGVTGLMCCIRLAMIYVIYENTFFSCLLQGNFDWQVLSVPINFAPRILTIA